MCLAVPGLVEELFDSDGLKMAKVNFGGIRKSICLQYTPDVEVGSYVLVHVGFAISVIDDDEAQRTLSVLKGRGELGELQGSPQLEASEPGALQGPPQQGASGPGALQGSTQEEAV